MDSIKMWTALIAATSIAGAVFTAFLPSGKMKKAFLTLVGIVFICAVVSPLASKEKIDFDFSDDIFSFSENEAEFDEKSNAAAMNVAKDGYETAIKNALEVIGYTALKVDVECNEELNAVKINVILNNAYDEKNVKSKIESICPGAEIEVSKGEKNERKT